MVPFWDLSGHINDLTSKKIPLTACTSRKRSINIFSGVIWATACQAVMALTCLVRRDIFLEAVLEWMAPS
jgi:hypothetical protein